MKHLTPILALTACLSSCTDDSTINQVIPPISEVQIPQGGHEQADLRVKALHDRYDSFFLYDFSAKDLSWSMVSSGMFDTQYRHTPIDPAAVPNLLDALQAAWLDFYPDDFLRRHLPRFIYLAETLESGELSYSYADDAFVTHWKSIPSRHLDHQIAVANISNTWAALSPDERLAFKNSLQSTMLNYCVASSAIVIPEAFYEVSSYGGNATTATKARNEGFIPNALTGVDWATNSTTLTRELDLEAYLNSLACLTTAQWRTLYSGKNKVKQKYDILVATLEQYGINASDIADFK